MCESEAGEKGERREGSLTMTRLAPVSNRKDRLSVSQRKQNGREGMGSGGGSPSETGKWAPSEAVKAASVGSEGSVVAR